MQWPKGAEQALHKFWTLIATSIMFASMALPTRAVEAADGVISAQLVHEETGQAVIGAPVQLDSREFTVSDEQGWFRFFNVPAGTHRISINDPECAAFSTSVELKPGEVLELHWALSPRGKQNMKEVVIRAKRMEEEVSDTVLEMEEVKKIPGTQGDILKIVQSLPGVARNLAFSGAGGAGVVIRGAAPEDSKVLIDDHPVPLLYHFGGLKSILNSDMLKRIDFLPGGFGAEFGSATGGIMDVHTLPCTHRQYDGYVELSLIDAGFFVQGPIGDNAGFVGAARRSTMDAWLPYVLDGLDSFELTVAPVYYDYQAKADWSPTEGDHLSVLAFGSSDEMRWLFSKPISADPDIRGDFGMKTQFHRLHLHWTHVPQDSSWQFRASIVGGYDSFNGSGGPFLMQSRVPNLAFRGDVEWHPSKIWKVQSGAISHLSWFDLNYSMVRPPTEGTVPNKFDTMEVVVGKEKWFVVSGGAYVSVSAEPVRGMLLAGGVRLDGYAFGSHGDWSVMPRFSFKQELRPGTVFKAGVGLYAKPAQVNELSEGFGNPDLKMERAIHYTLGMEQELPFHSSLDVSFFYKDLDSLVVNDDDTVYSNKGMGKISGLEIMLRKDLDHGLFGWLAYTLMRSERKDGPDEPWRLFSFDQTHILTLVAGFRLPRGEIMPMHGLRSGWEFGLRFQLVSGNPITPIMGGVFDADSDNYLPLPGPINSERLPLYHRLDIRVDYTWAFRRWALSLFLDLQNAYNHQSIEGVDYNYDYTERRYIKGLPVIPALGVRGSF